MPALVLAVALCLIVCWAYRNSLAAPFIFDDTYAIRDNPTINQLWPRSTQVGSRRPVGHFSFAMNHRLHGLDVRGYHVVNLAIHVAAALTLFGIVRRTTQLAPLKEYFGPRANGLAFCIALLWAVHPLQTGAVTYIVQRLESQMALFFLLTIYCVLRGSQSTKFAAWAWYVGAAVSCGLSMGTKEVAAVLPLVVLLYDRTFLSSSWKALARARWGFYGLFVPPFIWLLAKILPAFNPNRAAGASYGFGMDDLDPIEYLQTQPGVILHYLKLSYWPNPLCLDYRWEVARDPLEIFVPGVIVVGLLLASFLALVYRPGVGFLGMSFFIVLAPTSSLMPLRDLAFEHRMYLPLASVVALSVLFVDALMQRVPLAAARRAAVFNSIVAVCILALIMTTNRRNLEYANPMQLWSNTIAQVPNNDRAHYNLGTRYMDSRDVALARGEVQLAKDNQAQAKAYFQKAVDINPWHHRAHGNLAMILAAEAGNDPEKIQAAIKKYEQAVRIDAGNARAWDNFGNLYARQGDYTAAIDRYQKAIAVRKSFITAYLHLSLALFKLGRFEEALKPLEQAATRSPGNPDIMIRQAWILSTAPNRETRRGVEALRMAEEALAIRQSPYGLSTLAAAYAETGQYQKAQAAAEQALQVAPPKRVETYTQRLQTYAAGKPYRLSTEDPEDP